LKALGYLTSTDEGQAEAPIMERKIIKTGDVTIYIDNYDRFVNSLQNHVSSMRGYISQIQANRASFHFSNGLFVLRIPPERLTEFVSWLKEQGMVSSESIKADDISEQYYDLQARLDNARRFETRLLEMLKTQTGKLSDVVLVEEKLNEVREQIEQMEGKIKYF